MAKKSSVERNKKRIRLADKYAAKRAELLATAKDESLTNEERFKARLKLSELPRNSAKSRVRQPLWCDWSPTWLLQKIEYVPDLSERFGL
jgi:hypothetical protein